MIHVLLNDGMKIKKGDEICYNNSWDLAEDFYFGNTAKSTHHPIRRLIKTHEDFEAFWQEAIG